MIVFKQMRLVHANWMSIQCPAQGLGNYKANGFYLTQLLRKASERILVKFQLGEMLQVAT